MMVLLRNAQLPAQTGYQIHFWVPGRNPDKSSHPESAMMTYRDANPKVIEPFGIAIGYAFFDNGKVRHNSQSNLRGRHLSVPCAQPQSRKMTL